MRAEMHDNLKVAQFLHMRTQCRYVASSTYQVGPQCNVYQVGDHM